MVFFLGLFAQPHSHLAAQEAPKSSEVEDSSQLSEALEQLSSDETRTRRDAALKLYQLAVEGMDLRLALPSLITALEDREDQVWFHTVSTLAIMGPQAAEAAPKLLQALGNSNRRGVNVRWYRSAHALSQMGDEVVDLLLASCSEERASRRAGAAKALGGIPTSGARSVPVLMGLLGDDEDEVREVAIESLSLLADHSLEPLKQGLQHETSRVMAASCRALARLADRAQSASQELIDLAQRATDPLVLVAALESLLPVQASPQDILAVTLPHFDSQEEALQQAVANVMLALPPDQSVSALLHQAEHAQPPTSDRAVELLGYLGVDAAPALPLLMHSMQRWLDSPERLDPYRRAFLQVGPAGIPMVIEAMQLTDKEAHLEIFQTMLTEYGLLAVQPILELLPEQTELMQVKLIHALGGMGRNARSAQPALIRALETKKPDLQAASIQALAALEIKLEQFDQLIKPLLASASPAVLLASLKALSLRPEAVPAHLDALGQLLRSEDPSLRSQVLHTMVHAGESARKFEPEVAMLLADIDASVRLASMRVLTVIGETSPLALDQIAWLGRLGDAPTLQQALETLGRMGPSASKALPLFSESLAHEDPVIRLAAIEGILVLDPDPKRGLPIMLEALEDPSGDIRQAAMKALIPLKEQAGEAIPALIGLLGNSEDRELSLGALRVIPSQVAYLAQYLEALNHEDPGVRAFGCRSLGQLGSAAEQALPELRKVRRDRYRFVREQADEAIKQIEG